MRTVTVSKAKAQLSRLVDQVSQLDRRVVITKNCRPSAVLISHDEIESLEETVQILGNRRFVTEILEASARAARGQTVSYEEVFGGTPRRKS